MVALLFFMNCLHGTFTVWGNALIEIQTTGSCPEKLWGCKNTARCELKRHPLRGQRRLASCNLALLLIVLMLPAPAKSSITAPNSQCRLLNAISSLTECMQTKNTATVLYPRRGGFEPRGNANATSDNTNRVSLCSLESKTYTRTWNSHVSGWISWVKSHAMKCPWD